MKDNMFNFCPECGSRRIETKLGGRKWQCPECGFDLYNNVAAAVGRVIINENNECLFEKRAKEPKKGFLALPGGFCNPDETAEEGAVRECVEEIGVKPVNLKFICTFPNTYPYKEIVYKTCDIFFEATIPSGCVLKAQEKEVEDFVWMKVGSAEDVMKIPLAFDSARNTLLKRLEGKK